MKYKFSYVYALLAFLLFAAEVFIAVYLHDAIIRPYGGDFLVVILLYCFFKSFFDTKATITAIYVLIFAYLIELSQFFNLVNVLGLSRSRIAVVVLGSQFSWGDILAYTLGIIPVITVEQLWMRRKINSAYTLKQYGRICK